MRVCWFGIYDPEYSRNKILIDGLRANGVDVVECNVRTKGLRKYRELIYMLRALQGQYDVLYCAFPVYISILIAYFFQNKPIVVDAFVSNYDSLVNDRAVYAFWHPYAWFCYVLDVLMVKLADEVVVDTKEHKRFWSSWKRGAHIHVVPVGAHSEEFFPIEMPKNDRVLVQFHGSYIPLQGIDRIVEAVRILKDDDRFRFRFIGKGQLYTEIYEQATRDNLPITFVPWLSIEELNRYLNEADIILGIFGDTKKTDRVVPNKVYQGLAVRKPVLTKDTPAIRNEFSEMELYMCDNDPEIIARTIMKIVAEPERSEQIAVLGYNKAKSSFSETVIGKKLYTVIKEN